MLSSLLPKQGDNPFHGLSLRAWITLLIGMVVTVGVALGAHDFAMVGLGVPYPDQAAVPDWARLLRHELSMIGALLLCLAARPTLARWRLPMAITVTGTVLLAFNEVARNIVIEWVISDGWRGTNGIYILTKHMPRSLGYIYQAAVVVVAVRLLLPRGNCQTVAGVLLAGLAGFYLLPPVLVPLASAIRSVIDVTKPVDLYQPPWPLYVYTYIYGMYVEPVVATIVLAAACWPGVGVRFARRVAIFTVCILLLRGDFVTTFLYTAWVPQPLPMAIASEAQFFLEGLLLAVLAGSTWHLSMANAGNSALERAA